MRSVKKQKYKICKFREKHTPVSNGRSFLFQKDNTGKYMNRNIETDGVGNIDSLPVIHKRQKGAKI